MTTDERNDLIRSFSAAPELLRKALYALPKEMWQFKPAPKAWSVHQIVIHIPDSEATSFVRFRKLVAEPGSVLPVYDQDAFADHLDYHSQSIENALELFRLMRATTSDIISRLDESVWKQEAEHPESGTFSLEDWLRDYEAHIPLHIGQMQRNLASWRDKKPR